MQKQYLNYLNNRPVRQTLLVMLLVVCSGILLATSPLGRYLEENIGLPWLFKLRGPIAPPQEVAVVSIDQESARALNLPAKPRKWPRNLHGELVEKLSAHGATAIGFDIIFDEPRDAQDNARFAAGMRNANNVVLFQFIQQKEVFDRQGNRLPAEKISLLNPIETLADAAQGLSPFPLPKVPAQVNHVVLYKDILSDAPTLPATLLQVHARAAYADLLDLITVFEPQLGMELKQQIGVDLHFKTHPGGVQETVRHLRQVFLAHPKLAKQIRAYLQQRPPRMHATQAKRVRALLNLYEAPDGFYLNFYGPVHSIPTIPYYKVLASDPAQPSIDVRGKAIFVGFSEQFQPEQKDGFYTVFTDETSGADVSGVEIIATAFANLLHQEAIRIPADFDIDLAGWSDMLIILLWGLAISLILRLSSGLVLIPVTLLLGAGYAAMVYYSFNVHHLLLPFVNPLFVQLSLASLITFAFKYRQVQHERQLIRQAFGYHLPVAVVDQIAQGVHHLTTEGETVHGIVMATDAQQYTTLSEQLTPSELHELMNQYYAVLFKPIRDYHGIVSDVVGDAAMAIWASAPRQQNTVNQHQQACLAALAIQSALDEFNQRHPQHALPTRIGLDSGEILMGHVGALDHYEYRAIGDIVNTASRIEGVNKWLGTRIIVSKNVLGDTHGLLSRELGSFRLAGKQSPVSLYELIAAEGRHISAAAATQYNQFDLGLEAFRAADFQRAGTLFEKNKTDPVSTYYANLCRQYRVTAPTEFDGSVVLDKK